MYLKMNKIKFKKTQKRKLLKLEFKSNLLQFGIIGLKAQKSGIISINQLESAKQAIINKIKKKGKIWVKVIPNCIITKKPIGSRMGKGKGTIISVGSKVYCGNVIFEVCGCNINLIIAALKIAGVRLPIKTKIFM